MPLYVALGAGLSDRSAEKLHASFTLGSLGMASYGWGGRHRSLATGHKENIIGKLRAAGAD